MDSSWVFPETPSRLLFFFLSHWYLSIGSWGFSHRETPSPGGFRVKSGGFPRFFGGFPVQKNLLLLKKRGFPGNLGNPLPDWFGARKVLVWSTGKITLFQAHFSSLLLALFILLSMSFIRILRLLLYLSEYFNTRYS